MSNMFEVETKNVLTEAAKKVMELLDQEVRISISRECLEKLEENEIFAEATKEGVSREFFRSLVVPSLNHLIDNLNLEKFNDSMTMTLIRGSLDEKLDLTSFSGEDIFEIADSAGALAKIYEPEFKKKIVFNEAIELVTQKGNISINAAIKKVVADMQSEDYVARQIERSNELCDKIANIINPIVDFYLEHETEIILAVMMKKK